MTRIRAAKDDVCLHPILGEVKAATGFFLKEKSCCSYRGKVHEEQK
jgi:hypothetical protein